MSFRRPIQQIFAIQQEEETDGIVYRYPATPHSIPEFKQI